MKLEVLCSFSCCYIFYCKWLLSFSNEHTSVAEKLWLPGRKKKKSWTSKQSRLSPIACLPRQWRSNSSKAAGFFPLHLPLHPSFWEIPRHSLNQQLCPHDALFNTFFSWWDYLILIVTYLDIFLNEFVKFLVNPLFGV